jgi:hypothetical protein
MIKHQETHPNLDVEGCFGCKVAGLSIAASATPTRRDGRRAATINHKDKVLEKDLDAYKRLRQEGLQPKAIVTMIVRHRGLWKRFLPS